MISICVCMNGLGKTSSSFVLGNGLACGSAFEFIQIYSIFLFTQCIDARNIPVFRISAFFPSETMSPPSFFALPQFVDKHMLPSELTTYTSILISTAVIAILVGITSLVNSFHPPFYSVGKSWFFSLVSGWNAMTFTIEKHVQEGYATVRQQCKSYLGLQSN